MRYDCGRWMDRFAGCRGRSVWMDIILGDVSWAAFGSIAATFPRRALAFLRRWSSFLVVVVGFRLPTNDPRMGRRQRHQARLRRARGNASAADQGQPMAEAHPKPPASAAGLGPWFHKTAVTGGATTGPARVHLCNSSIVLGFQHSDAGFTAAPFGIGGDL